MAYPYRSFDLWDLPGPSPGDASEGRRLAKSITLKLIKEGRHGYKLLGQPKFECDKIAAALRRADLNSILEKQATPSCRRNSGKRIFPNSPLLQELLDNGAFPGMLTEHDSKDNIQMGHAADNAFSGFQNGNMSNTDCASRERSEHAMPAESAEEQAKRRLTAFVEFVETIIEKYENLDFDKIEAEATSSVVTDTGDTSAKKTGNTKKRLHAGSASVISGDVLAPSVLHRLTADIGILQKRGQMAEVPTDLLATLLPILDKQVQAALEVDVFGLSKLGKGDEEWEDSGKDTDRRLILDEMIENCLLLCKHLFSKFIIPATDPNLSNETTQIGDSGKEDEGNEATESSSRKKTKRRLSGGRRRRGDLGAASMDIINQLSSTVLSAFAIETSPEIETLQLAAIELMRALFLRYAKHRSLVLEEIFGLLVKLPSSKRTLRTFKLYHSTECIQMVSALVLLLIQSCPSTTHPSELVTASVDKTQSPYTSAEDKTNSEVKVADTPQGPGRPRRRSRSESMNENEGQSQPAESGKNGVGPDQLDDLSDESRFFLAALDSAVVAAQTFISNFLKRCKNKKDEGSDYRQLLLNFVEDLLLVVSLPEWPAAETTIQCLSGQLVNVLTSKVSGSSKNLESSFGLLALDLLGKVEVRLREIVRDCRGINLSGEKNIMDSLDALEQVLPNCMRKSSIPVGGLQSTKVEDEEDEAPLSTLLGSKPKDETLSHTETNKKERATFEEISEGFSMSRKLELLFLRHFEQRVLEEESLQDAQRFYICFFAIGSSREAGTLNTDPPEWYQLLRDEWREPTSELETKLLRRFAVELSRANTVDLSKTLFCERSLCKSSDTLLGHTMRLLNEDQATYRAKVLKALDSIVVADPAIMAEDQFRNAVHRCFLDEAISVRQAAVDLVGRYVIARPELVELYMSSILERILDKGVSVRKSVVKIVRDHLLTQPNSKYRTPSCVRLVSRIADPAEEETIKDLVTDTFKGLWFSTGKNAPSATGNGQTSGVGGTSYTPSATKVLSTTTPNGKTPSRLLRTPSSTGNGDELHSGITPSILSPNFSRTPVKAREWNPETAWDKMLHIVEVVASVESTEWLVCLVESLLYGPEEGTKEKKEKLRERKEVERRCKEIIMRLMQALLQAEEGHPLAQTTSLGSDRADHLVYLLSTLRVFCMACPESLVPHFPTLVVYLKADNDVGPNREVKIIKTMTEMLQMLLPLLRKGDREAVIEAEQDLERIVYRFPPSVVGPSIKCLSAISMVYFADQEGSTTSTKNEARLPGQAVFFILHKFFGYLHKYKNAEARRKVLNPPSADAQQILEAKQVNANLQRALYVVGLIATHVDLDSDLAKRKLESISPVPWQSGQVSLLIYDMFDKYLAMDNSNIQLLTKTIQGVGFLFARYPRYMLKAEETCIFEALLEHKNELVQRQTLISLTDILRGEEERVDSGLAKRLILERTKKAEQVSGDQDADASVIGGVIQLHLPSILNLSISQSPSMRREAAELIGVVMRQGLVSPVPCLPFLVALSGDFKDKETNEVAVRTLIKVNEKFPSILHLPAVDGVVLSYRFQQRVYGAWKLLLDDGHGASVCSFGRFYGTCIRNHRGQRNTFLKKLLILFEENTRDKRGKGANKNALDSEVENGEEEAYGQSMNDHSMSLNSTLSAAPLNKVSLAGKLVIDGSMPAEDLFEAVDCLRFITHFMGKLPYTVQEEALFIIYLINRHISLKAGPLMDWLKHFYASLKAGYNYSKQSDIDDDLESVTLDMAALGEHFHKLSKQKKASFKRKLAFAFASCFLIQLKHYLKQVYQLSDMRCQSYSPFDTSKATEKAANRLIVLPEFKTISIPGPENWSTDEKHEAASNLSVLWGVIPTLNQLLKEDPADFTLAVPSKKRARRRSKGASSATGAPAAKRRRSKTSLEADDAEEDDDQADPDYVE